MSLADEEYAELAQDIPSAEDPFIKQFISGSDSLKDKEAALRSDAAFRSSSSHMARRTSAIVKRILQDDPKTPHPDLKDIIQHMPKGALLNCHLFGMVAGGETIDALLNTPGMHMSASTPLDTPELRRGTSKINFRFRAKEESGILPWHRNYLAGSWSSITKVAQGFPEGGEQGFRRWLLAKTSIRHDDLAAGWDRLQYCLQSTQDMVCYEPVLRAYLRHVLDSLVQEHVSWAEMRTNLNFNFYRKGKEAPEADCSTILAVVDDELRRFKSDSAHASFHGLRLIWTTSRSGATRSIIQDMDSCITAKLEFPHLIAGFDVSGKEAAGRSLKSLLPEIFWFKKQCSQEGVEIPFFFRAGGSPFSGPRSPDDNLYDAILLGSRRLGGAFTMSRHPLLADMVKEKRILIETCPSSDERFSMGGPVASHPIQTMQARGVPCALGLGAPIVIQEHAAGLSSEFGHALHSWGNLGLSGLGALAENSVRWAAFEDEDATKWTAGIKEASLGGGVKAQRLKEWATEWERFCLWVVEEYGEKYEETAPRKEDPASGPEA